MFIYIYTSIQKTKGRGWQKMVLDQYPLVYFYLVYCHIINNKGDFICENRHNINKSLLREVSSSSFLRSPINLSQKKPVRFLTFVLPQRRIQSLVKHL